MHSEGKIASVKITVNDLSVKLEAFLSDRLRRVGIRVPQQSGAVER